MSEPLKFDLHLLNKYIQTRNVCNIIVNEKKDELWTSTFNSLRSLENFMTGFRFYINLQTLKKCLILTLAKQHI